MLVTQASARVKGSFKMALGDTMLVAAESGRIKAWGVTSYGRQHARLDGRQLMAVSESLELAVYMAPGAAQGKELTLVRLRTAEPEQRWSWTIGPAYADHAGRHQP